MKNQENNIGKMKRNKRKICKKIKFLSLH